MLQGVLLWSVNTFSQLGSKAPAGCATLNSCDGWTYIHVGQYSVFGRIRNVTCGWNINWHVYLYLLRAFRVKAFPCTFNYFCGAFLYFDAVRCVVVQRVASCPCLTTAQLVTMTRQRQEVHGDGQLRIASNSFSGEELLGKRDNRGGSA